MRNYGPQSIEKLVDKGALVSNILIRAFGSIIGNVGLNRLKGITGNIPGASMSVAQTTSNATAELGLNAPQAKIQDIFTEALLDPEVTQALLARVPKDEKKALQYFRSLPAIFYTSGIRGEVDALPSDSGDITIPLGGADSDTLVEQETVSPAPEPAPQPAPPRLMVTNR